MRAGGVRARVIEEGSGAPVLLVHGVGAWAENWRDQLPALAAAGFRAVACDLPGFGRSEAPRGASYFAPDDPYYARFTVDLLDALEIERADLVGHSLGGAVAAVTAICAPERVRRLALVSSGGFGAEVPAIFRLMSLPPLEHLARFAPDALVRSVVRSTFYDLTAIPAWLYADAIRYTRAGGGREFVRVMRAVAGVRGQSAELRRRWQERARVIRCPVLVVWGREDRVIPVAHADAARALLPRARVEVIERAGHLVMVERPGEFDRILVGFLRGP